MKAYLPILLLAAVPGLASRNPSPAVSGHYLETRSCDVYIGQCFANGQMNLAGKEAILVWSIDQGAWEGTRLDGLSIIAAVRTDGTLGDQHFQPREGQAVMIVDDRANAEQREALCDLARSLAGHLIKDVAQIRTAPIQSAIATCGKAGCASVKAGGLVEIETRCLNEHDHLCGNEVTFYPPLTDVQHALPAYTELAAYRGGGLSRTWEDTDQRSAFIATFTK